ncbi:aspartic peptidase domain-containing protein [Abortiporus biennis]|nr:aspartic peptidase domain-containing protein [Abortiporus biennis]
MPVRRAQPYESTVFSFNNSVDPYNFGIVNKDGDGTAIYVGTIYVDDQPFEIQLDSGSSDLWIDSANVTFESAENTHIFGKIGYGDGTVAAGDIYVAPVKFGDFTIKKQAFINAPRSNATANNDKGLLGIGPPNLSIISNGLVNSSYDGSSLMQNIFNLYPNKSNFMTMQLSRSDLGMVDGGVFTIGEIDPNYAAITSSPKLEVFTTHNFWETIVDSVIINGNPYSGHGNNQTNSTHSNNLIVNLDSGTTLGKPLLPPYLVDLMYKNVPGAKLVSESLGFYELPCDTKLNVSFVFAGQEYPIHPIDLIVVGSSDDDSTTICGNAYRYYSPDDGDRDMLLGDSFLKNVYALFDFGNYSRSSDENPYIQLLSLTDKDKAWAEFDTLNANRIHQWETLKTSKVNANTNVPETPVVAGNAASGDLTSSPSESSESDSFHSSALLRNSYIIIGLLAGAIIMLFIVAILLFRNQRKVDLGTTKRYKSVSNPVKPFEHKQRFSYETPYDS